MKSIALTCITTLAAAIATTRAAEITWTAHNITAGRGTYPTNTGGSNYSGFLSV